MTYVPYVLVRRSRHFEARIWIGYPSEWWWVLITQSDGRTLGGKKKTLGARYQIFYKCSRITRHLINGRNEVGRICWLWGARPSKEQKYLREWAVNDLKVTLGMLGTLHPQERGGFQGRPEGVTSAKSFMMQKSLFTTFVVPEGRVKNSEL